MHESTATAVTRALPSATVVLVRDGADGPEVLMVLRHARTSFGASYVFPGGLLHADDDAVGARCLGIDDSDADRILSLERGGLAYFSAAIRELFEEAGVLLARDADGGWANASALSHHREPLNDGSESWQTFLEQHDLRLVCDGLHYFSFWVTPREAHKRFSTRFFVAGLPDGQDAEHCGTEVTDSRWMTPAGALEESGAGKIEIPHPTIRTLKRLTPFRTSSDMVAWAKEQERAGVECLLPAIVTHGDAQRVVMPGDPDYPHYPDEDTP